MVIKLSLFKIQFENGELYKSKSGRVQHYKSIEKAVAKIEKLGEIAIGAKAVECRNKTKKAKAAIIAVKSKKGDAKAVKAVTKTKKTK